MASPACISAMRAHSSAFQQCLKRCRSARNRSDSRQFSRIRPGWCRAFHGVESRAAKWRMPSRHRRNRPRAARASTRLPNSPMSIRTRAFRISCTGKFRPLIISIETINISHIPRRPDGRCLKGQEKLPLRMLGGGRTAVSWRKSLPGNPNPVVRAQPYLNRSVNDHRLPAFCDIATGTKVSEFAPTHSASR
jgi:hypothetical protein